MAEVGAPLLSVIIPAHGRQADLDRAVRSAAGEPVDLEIIVVDDASADPLALPDELAGDARLRLVVRTSNGGAGAARNAGLAMARGRLVTFLDSDDRLLPGTLSPRLDHALALAGGPAVEPLAAVGCGWVDRIDGIPARTRVPHPPAGPIDFFGGCWVSPGSAVLFNRIAFERIGGFDERFRRLEDVDLFIRLMVAGGRFHVDPAIGADIAVGGAKPAGDVAAACQLLLDKHRTVPPAARRRLLAYVALEQARLAWQVGNRGRAALRLAASFAALPRLRLNTGAGWTITPLARDARA